MAGSLTLPSSPQDLAKALALLDEPAGPPPPGVKPTFVKDSSLSAPLVFSFAFCMIISTLFVLIRLYTKVAVMKSKSYEDCKSIE